MGEAMAYEKKLAPVLSVLDGIRPDAAAALRENIAADMVGEHALHVPDSEYPLSHTLSKYMLWEATPQGNEYWHEVYNQLRIYDRAWFLTND